MNNINKLVKLYHTSSKHSNYQILSSGLQKILSEYPLDVQSRSEKERLECICSSIEVRDKIVLDIGGNSGYFSFEMLDRGASKVIYYEGNEAHSEFVRKASEVLGYEEKIQIYNKYFSFEKDTIAERVDIGLLLNVLHHIGDDFGNQNLSISLAKEEILKNLNTLSLVTDVLIFQLGYCWKGDRTKLLFNNGTKSEMIDFIKDGTKGLWIIEKILIPEKTELGIEYKLMSESNMARCDRLGEFLNRPLFFLKSCRF